MMCQLLILVFISCLSSTVVQSVSLTKSEIRSTSFTMIWNPQSAVNYKISIVKTGFPAAAASARDATSPYEVTSTTDPAGALITPDTEYDIYLYSGQSGSFAEVDDFLRLSTASAAPSNVQITNVQSTQFKVHWDHANNGAQVLTEYQVLYQTGGTTSHQSTADATASSLTITGLTTNTDYSVTVVGWKDTEIFTDESNPPALVATFSEPTSVTLTPSSSSSIDVTWDAPVVSGGGSATIAGYKISWTPPHSSGVKTVTGTAISDQITGLNGNTAYSVTVAAMSSASGVGALSNFKSAATGIAKPTALTTGDSTSSMIDVTWTKSPSGGNVVAISGYELSWTPADGGGSMMATTDGSTPTTISGLNSNTEYTIQVTATSDSGNGDKSDAVKGTTVSLQASQPTNSSNPTINSITLQWTAVSGDSPSLMYQVDWNPSGSTGSSISVVETSTTISDLTASTRYSFTVTTVNDGGSADPSDPAMFSTLPNQPDSPTLSRPSTNPTTQIYVEWNEPSGGDDIVDYVVDWFLSKGGSIVSHVDFFIAATTSYTIEGLTPGETYDVTVKARNSAGAGQPSTSERDTTNPDSVKNFTVKQNSNEPDKILDLTWETPSGTGDNITIQYWSLTEHTMNTTSVEFEIFKTSLFVVPGNNYTVTVTVHSKGYESTPESIDTNSKPSEPHFVVDVFTNELQINWTSPDGHYEGLAIFFNNTDIEVGNSGTYSFTGLAPYTEYEVEMYSWITNVKREVERSRTSPGTYATLPGPPPQPVFNSSLSDNAESSVNTIIFVLPPNTFSEENGPIEYFAVYLAFGDPPNLTPNVTNMRNCESLTSGDECVTLWTDDEGNLVQGNARQKTKRSVLTRQTGSIEFTIGDGSVTLSPWNVEFQNYPLQPDTGYRVAVAAKTGYEQMTATEFYPTIMTDSTGGGSGSGPNTGLIVGLVFAAIIAVIAIVGGIYYYRRRTFYEKERPYGSNSNSIEISHNASPARSSRTYNTNSSITKSDCSRSIPTSHLDDYMIKMREDSYNRLTEEYEELKDVGVGQSTSEAIKSENYTKNRYKKNILPYDITRVKLEMIGDEPGTDFIHANYIPGYKQEKEFIATQGPLPTTKEDFWRMIWEQNSRTIVMLTQIVEGERVKCDHYWPYNNEPVVMAGIAVKLVMESTSKDWVYREFMLSRDTEQRLVTQFHYIAWPDHGVPETAENLVKFVRYFQRQVSHETRDCGPMTVHCSAGVGRTGTFIAMDRLLQHMKDHDYVDIFGIVHEMRRHRMSMVQTDKQYILLHEMVQDVINEVYDTTDEVPVYENTVQSPIYENATFSGLHG